jgi:microcystin-dependent protein
MRHLARTAVCAAAIAATVYTPQASAQAEPLIGQIACFAFNFAPRGWAELNGQLLPIAQNTALFALLGTTYGGDGRTTFALPDLRGRMIMGVGSGPGLTPRILGEVGGHEHTTLSTNELPAHTHQVAPLASGNDANAVSPAGKVPATKARTTLYTDPANLVTMAPAVTSASGNGQPFDNMPPYGTFTCAIALEGIFPSRN